LDALKQEKEPEMAPAENGLNGALPPLCAWKSRIGRRIAVTVFATVALTQAAVLLFILRVCDIGPLAWGQEIIGISAAVILLASGFVTGLLMLVLGRWFLAPMEVLRYNLLSAVKNPESPDIQSLKKETQDEIGMTVGIANELIRQNSDNLVRLRTQAEDKIRKLAYFDSLTGLPNRTFFLEKLGESIQQKVQEEGGKLAVISIDIDNFKDVNDTMGHEVGDRLLEAIGKRLVKTLPPDAVVARVSADEFTAIVNLGPEHPDSAVYVERIFVSMIDPVNISKERLQVRVSMGVAHYPDDGDDPHQLLKNADIALNRAKEEGRDTVRYYSQDFDRIIQRRFRMLRDLRIAMDQKQLKLHYHPQFELKTGRLVAAEALLRWWRPDTSKEGGGGKYIPPSEFIPIAEQSGLIVPIGEYVLRTACETNKKWQERGLPPIRIAVNISGVQFHRGDIVSLVSAVLEETKLEPRWLELEVTEGVFMESMQVAINTLNQLHQLGIELAVDDFGTGYSSLSYLRQFPIDRLKIDQSFIVNAATNQDDRIIVRTIIQLGHNLGLKVIAEGVETIEHETLLREEGCDESQGFKYIQPIPEEEFWDFAVAYNRSLAEKEKSAATE
jgi:diguanylate cyclase (GGDEF)-like protein